MAESRCRLTGLLRKKGGRSYYLIIYDWRSRPHCFSLQEDKKLGENRWTIKVVRAPRDLEKFDTVSIEISEGNLGIILKMIAPHFDSLDHPLRSDVWVIDEEGEEYNIIDIL